jgi:tetratricopeptide (TPR) repeat protein
LSACRRNDSHTGERRSGALTAMATTKTPRKARTAARAPSQAPAQDRFDSSEILFDSGSTVVEHVHGDTRSRWLAICLSPDDLIAVRSFGYYQQALRQAGFDVLAVKQASVTGYADLSAAIMAGILQKLPAYDGVVALGADTGGYAAIRLLSPFDNLPIVALSPRLPGDPGPAEAIHSDVYVAYDPKSEADQTHCRNIAKQYPRIQPLRMHSAGAPTRHALEETGTLIPFLVGLVSGQPIDPVAHFRSNRNRSALSLYHIATNAMNRRHMKTARVLLARAVKLDDQLPIAFAYARALAESGKPEQAIAEIDKLLVREPNISHYWATKGYFHELAGEDRKALEATRRAIAVEPELEYFRIAERRLLDRLYDDMAKRNQMTLAALEKARGELAMQKGFHENEDFDGKRMAALIALSLGIVAMVALIATLFRLI